MPIDLARRQLAVECPQCLRQVFLTLGPGRTEPDGTVTYDGTLGREGLLLHMMVGCEARSE